jgi:hypothetical protein
VTVVRVKELGEIQLRRLASETHDVVFKWRLIHAKSLRTATQNVFLGRWVWSSLFLQNRTNRSLTCEMQQSILSRKHRPQVGCSWLVRGTIT